ncbi:hypothetical protein EVA_02751 [gut metagenome]|uniref:Uncharacterized protein n=1 Tax=gut metagenome TaxID=749906 RepID=J9GNE7_9ZZZZ
MDSSTQEEFRKFLPSHHCRQHPLQLQQLLLRQTLHASPCNRYSNAQSFQYGKTLLVPSRNQGNRQPQRQLHGTFGGQLSAHRKICQQTSEKGPHLDQCHGSSCQRGLRLSVVVHRRKSRETGTLRFGLQSGT